MIYQYTELPPEKLTKYIPCMAWMHWTGYDTKIIETVIDGRDIVIQLWKGFMLPIIPGVGGYGAEIGLYFRNQIPGMWWPDYKHKKNISFSLINPITNDEFFSAGPKQAWWLHKWMTMSSYKEYKKHNKVPTSPAQYILKFSIGDREFTW